MKLIIKNMISMRCKMIVESEAEKLGIHPVIVELGEAEIRDHIGIEALNAFKESLLGSGLIVLDDERAQMIERIKAAIIEMVYERDELPKVKYSVYLSEALDMKYSQLAKLFATVKGTTITHYIIYQKVERIKELLVYKKLSLSDIMIKMQYSSVQHLSSQFKNISGLTITHFVKLKEEREAAVRELAKAVA